MLSTCPNCDSFRFWTSEMPNGRTVEFKCFECRFRLKGYDDGTYAYKADSGWINLPVGTLLILKETQL